MSNQADQAELASRVSSTFQPITGTPIASNVGNTLTNGSEVQRSETQKSHKEFRDPQLDINQPYRSLTQNANFDEYTSSRESGEIPVSNHGSGKPEYKLVTFLLNDPENPKNWSKAYKWWCTMVVAFTCFVVAFCSSVVTADIIGVEEEFGMSEEIVLLSVTLFVVGFGLGMHPIPRCL